MTPRPTRIIILESPFLHPTRTREECVRYALWAAADATREYREAVYASHLLTTQWLPEDKLSRDWGLACRDMIAKASMGRVVRYVDLGVTPGMVRDVDCTAVVEERRLRDWARGEWLFGGWPEGTIRPVVVA